ncbi:SDR family oxidoreductase [Staphylococcus pseudintermedius]|uniref:SDR family oxidoreductase n=1 Tax=Staphylococcus pseudintermedius TaxID=283734 RepID=UPI001BDF5F2C|nr:SDR family oxidoreductase [Staphylococcus pseudintermedius]HEC2183909.1 SDR family oxidoreductase [Staphylococcus delphini]EJA1860820.1 SDR family oxidoreductase [Staphylococcus pseudintermedius]EKH2200376.1 SDR family oxidoreductase [Staphylococcus pseudintermedius]EMB9414037.1 SDR family oxidoreductase [Staphylococcus pseudintermedius]MBU7229178.1 SDR family oxidoreductase [Staphylococcus pseudintermedius]
MSVYLILGGDGQISNDFIEKYIDLSMDKLLLVDISFSQKRIYNHENVFLFKENVAESDYKNIINFLDSNNLLIDKIIYSAGKNPMKNFFDSNISEFKDTLNSNLFGFYLCLKMLYAWFNNDVSIVAIASQNGVVGHENRIDYGCSKAGLIHMVKNLTIDFSLYSAKNIKVNCISPGYVITSKSKDFFKTTKGKKLLSRNPYNKAISLTDISSTIHFLLSNHSDSIRGQNIIIDYGYTIR